MARPQTAARVQPGGSPPRRCAVLGSPIAHSLSPVLHRAAYAELGLDWSYEAVEVTDGRLAAFLDGLDETWRGLSLTMPLKRAVVPLLEETTDRAWQAGAVNTVLLDDGRRRGDNTDVPGAAAAVRERWSGPCTEALVLGGGATAASTLLALADLGCSAATVAVRSPERAWETLEAVRRHPRPPDLAVIALGAGPVPRCDIVVSTIPARAQDAWVCEAGAATPVVFEVLYDPWPTPLAAAATAAGRVLVGGLDLLVHQAVLQVELMAGTRPSLGAMRAAGQGALAARTRS